MAITEGGTTLPTDSASKTQNGFYDGTDFWHPHLESATSKALRISNTDSAGSPIKQDGAAGGKLLGVSQYGRVASGGDRAVQVGFLAAAGDSVISGAGAVVNLDIVAPGANFRNVLGAVYPGYDATPPAGSTLTITEDPDGTPVIKFTLPIVAAGVIPLVFAKPREFTTNKKIRLTLSAGGGAILGYIAVDPWIAAV